jgi:beta-glucoside operon transcriptional antiterminator
LTNEIKLLYKKEFEIALWAKEEIKKDLGVEIPLDEVAHIALHIHTAKLGGHSMSDSMTKATILRDFIEQVEKKMEVEIEESSINYQRLITHLRFALNRIEQGSGFEPIDEDMLNLIKEKYQSAYECSKSVVDYLHKEYGITFPQSEVAYISLHIQRLVK